MSFVIRCSRCRRRLSAPLRSQTAETLGQDGAPYFERGHWAISDGDAFAGTEGALLIHVEDRYQLRDHHDRSRFTGCCGPDGSSGPNQVCRCWAAVATLKGDCWHPHCVVFEPGKVELVDAEVAQQREAADGKRRRLWAMLLAALALAAVVASTVNW